MSIKKLKSKEPGEPKEETNGLMDETIWKEFPEELIECVLTRVPIATLIRFRLVCRKWNSLPFLQRCTPKELPLLYASVGQYEALYDPLVKKWYFSTLTSSHWGYGWCNHQRGSSSGGLICYPHIAAASFHIVNHLTHRSMVFHCSSLKNYKRCAMALADCPGGYKIVWLQVGGEYGVHDYSSGKWTTTQGRVPDNIELPCLGGNRGLAIGNVVYFNCNKNRILSYDIVSGVWEQLLAPRPSYIKYEASLAEGEGGRLLLVGLVKCDDDDDDDDYDDDDYDYDDDDYDDDDYEDEREKARLCSQVCVWEVDSQEHRWVEADRMPSSLWSEFKYVESFKIMGTRRLLVISFIARRYKPTVTQVEGVFTYDVVNREWSNLPDCIPPGCTEPQSVLGITVFPCLSATP